MKLLENTYINKCTIKLRDNKYLSYKPIYGLSLIKLQTLETYIEIYLKIKFS